MVPSSKWFPTNLAARAAWFANFAAQFANYAAALGLSSFTTQVANDNDDFQSIAATRLTVKNFDSAIADFLKEMTEFSVGSPQPVFPTENFKAPPQNVAAGIFQRLDELRALIMAQPNYTVAMGTSMGIETSGGGNGLAAEFIKPEIEVFAAATGYLYSVVTTHRHNADQWLVSVSEAGSVDWTTAITATGKSVDVTYVPKPGSKGPVQLQVRVQLRRNNANYGTPSQIVLVTVNP